METSSLAAHPAALQRRLKLIDAIMLVAGSMIGSGVFIVGADMSRTLGGAGWVLVAWLLTGVITVFGALSYGELAAMSPQAGGQYVYLRQAYGTLFGFLYGWTLFFIIQTGTIAAVAVAFAKFTAVLFPFLGDRTLILQAGPVRLSAERAVAIASIVLLTIVNMRGIVLGKTVQNLLTTFKVLALLGIIIVGMLLGYNAGVFSSNLAGFWQAAKTVVSSEGALSSCPLYGLGLVTALGVGMVGALFSSTAWNNVTFAAGEVEKPERNLPRSLAIGTMLVVLLYLGAHLAYFMVLPSGGRPDGADILERGMQFAASDRVGTAMMDQIFGQPGAMVMALLIMVSTFGCNNGIILSGARVYYAMSRDGLFLKGASVLNSRAVPANALLFQCVWASLLCLSGTYGNLLDYVIFATLIFDALTVGAVFVLRRKMPAAPRPYRAWGYPLVPIIFMLLTSLIAVDLLIYKPGYTWPGIGLVLLGLPAFFLWNKKPPETRAAS
ncbi:MAG TPA: amino acid permease [Elusimicrobiales bacterium]|nr:amino acid permease [Elusimicrobiales bacterium]